MKGLVLAGGHGTRLRPLTSTGNKHMIPVANQPILFYSLRQLADVGVRDVGIVLGPIREGIRESVGSGEDFGLEVTYIEQGPPRGLADAVRCAREFLGNDAFIMYLGDNLLESGLRQFVDRFGQDRPDAVLGVTPVSRPHRYGIIELDGARIVSIEEKPRTPRSNLAIIGVYIFSPRIHAIIESLRPSGRGELEITDAIRDLSQLGAPISVQQVLGWWKDTGAPEDLLEANDLVLNSRATEFFSCEGTVQHGATITGKVALGRGSIIESGASVAGPTVIGKDARIAHGTTLGPNTAVGDRAELLGCSIRRSILLEGARVIGPVVIRDSLIGRDCEVRGNGQGTREATIVIGDGSRVYI